MGDHVLGGINYLTQTTDGCPPWFQQDPTKLYINTNIAPNLTRVTVHDLRGQETHFNLDTCAFEVLNYDGSVQAEFDDGSGTKKAHYQEMSDLLKKHLNASRVIFYHHVFRARGRPRPLEHLNEYHRNPLFYPHVDVDPAGAYARIKDLLGEEGAKKAMEHRWQLLNVWRPIGPHPITDSPLTICDYRSVQVDKDVHRLEIRGRTSNTSAYTMTCNDPDVHRWYYLSQMRSSEMFLFKMFDSKSGVAPFAFHTAFTDGHEAILNDEQKSLEMRCFVSYDHTCDCDREACLVHEGDFH